MGNNESIHILTSESVTEGHPDKVCDQISDAILDAILEKDPQAHVACECCTTTGLVMIMGEVSTTAQIDTEAIARNTIRRIGYTDGDSGLDADNCAIITCLKDQSPDIAQGVNNAEEARVGSEEEEDKQGAGDQGIVYGYATAETEDYMPLTLDLASKLAQRLAQVRKDGIIEGLRPDGKTQVSVAYQDGKPKRVASVLVSAQHTPEANQDDLKQAVWDKVVLPVIDHKWIDSDTEFFFNPTGRFEIGGPRGDAGLTGRKLIVDTYGGCAHHGGGAFSGKDPSKVDRSASYYARYAAKNLVASGLCSEVEIQVAYAIGRATPMSIDLTSFNTGKISDHDLLEIVEKVFDFRPGAIIRRLDLRRPIYEPTASYGHFGRDDLNLPWEKLDKVDEIKEIAKEYM